MKQEEVDGGVEGEEGGEGEDRKEEDHTSWSSWSFPDCLTLISKNNNGVFLFLVVSIRGQHVERGQSSLTWIPSHVSMCMTQWAKYMLFVHASIYAVPSISVLIRILQYSIQ